MPSPSPADFAPAPPSVADDSAAIVERWLASQQALIEASGQWFGGQQALLKRWFALLDAWNQPWQTTLDAGSPPGWSGFGPLGTMPDPLAAGWALMSAWWSPWAAALVRGGEQLA